MTFAGGTFAPRAGSTLSLANPLVVKQNDTISLDLGPQLHEVRHARPSHPVRVEVSQKVGLGVAEDSQHGGVASTHVTVPRQGPGRSPVQGLVGGELDERAPHVLILVLHLHQAGTHPVRLSRERSSQGCVLHQALNEQVLPRLEVVPDPQDQPRVALQPLRVLHLAGPPVEDT